MEAVYATRKVKISATDKPWITSSLKLLIAQCEKPLLNGGRLLNTISGFGIGFRKRVLNVRNVF